MLVSQLMQTEVESIAPDALVNDAALAMADAHITGLPVTDRSGRLVGVISTTDIAAAEGEAENSKARVALFECVSVRALMSSRPITTRPDATISEAAQQLLRAGVHRLFVVDGERLDGVISTTDILRAVANGQV
jgi:CBS domain-containing protein